MMDKNTFFTELYSKNVLKFPSRDFKRFLSSYTLHESISTGVVGDIEIYHGNNNFIIVEEDGKGVYYIRPFQNQVLVDKFINDRSTTYDRMWDGCGCKINYEDVWEVPEQVSEIKFS